MIPESQKIFSIEVGEFPKIYITMTYPPAGILCGRSPADESYSGAALQLRGGQSDIIRFIKKVGAHNAKFEFNFHGSSFNRLLAKIGHSFAVALAGLDGIDYF